MKRLRLAKVFFALGVLAFVVKPFYGFEMAAKHYHPAKTSILIKVFSKRGTELQDDPSFGISDSDKKLRHPDFWLVAGIAACPNFIFPAGTLLKDKTGFYETKFKPNSPTPSWLMNRQLII